MAATVSVSEYQRSYQPFGFGSGLCGVAGLSSMDLAVTREPAFQGKRKSPDRHRRKPLLSSTVNALIDPVDSVGKSTTELKRQKFLQFQKLREINNPLKLPLSEYALQYNWKDQGDPSPMLGADSELKRQQIERSTQQEVERPGQVFENKVVGNKPIVKEEKERPRLLLSKENGVSDDGEDDGNTENQANIRKHGEHRREGSKHQHRHKHRSKHRKHPQQRRWRSIPLSTEYRQQFKMWPLNTSPDNPPKNLKGSSPASLPPAGTPPRLHSPSDPRLQRHSPIKMSMPKTTCIPNATEYKSNYKSPDQSKYIRGAWLQSNQSAKNNNLPQDSESGWLAQVQELKDKCSEYKARSHGTFFSRDYLDSLEQQQLSLLETASSALSTTISDTCSTCDTATVVSEDLKVQDVEEGQSDSYHTGDEGSSQATASTPKLQHPIVPHHSDQESEEESVSPASVVVKSSQPFKPHNARVRVNKSQSQAVDHVRPPTPELKGKTHWGTRHHLNRTTPFSGSFFSPQKKGSNQHPPNLVKTLPVSPKYRRDMASRAPIFPATVPKTSLQANTRTKMSEYERPLDQLSHSIHRTRNLRKNKQHGLPEYVKDKAGGLECSVCGAELDGPGDPNANPLEVLRKKQPSNNMHTKQVQSSSSPKLASPRVAAKHMPSDLQSLSNLSASSCSIASSVLERARARRDNFWNE